MEKQDATLFKEGDTVTFINWGNMKVANIRKDDAGDIVSIEADLDLDNKAWKLKIKCFLKPLRGHSLTIHKESKCKKELIGYVTPNSIFAPKIRYTAYQ